MHHDATVTVTLPQAAIADSKKGAVSAMTLRNITKHLLNTSNHHDVEVANGEFHKFSWLAGKILRRAGHCGKCCPWRALYLPLPPFRHLQPVSGQWPGTQAKPYKSAQSVLTQDSEEPETIHPIHILEILRFFLEWVSWLFLV